MANIKAQATGLWSAGGTWSGGVPPGVGDVAYSNTFTVTIDQNITCSALLNGSNTGITPGGSYIISTIPGGGRTLNCDIGNGQANGMTNITTILDITGSSGTVTINGNLYTYNNTITQLIKLGTASQTLIINGNLIGSPISGSPLTTPISINANNQIITINGNIDMANNTNSGIQWVSGTGCSISVTGYVTAGTGNNGAHAISLAAGIVTVTVVGNVTASLGAGISTTGASTITVTGNITGGTQQPGITATGACVITINGNITGSNANNGVASSNASAKLIVNGNLIHGLNNFPAVFVRQMSVVAGTTVDWVVKDDSATTAGANVHLKNTGGAPLAPADVRLGTTYGVNSSVTGTLAMPSTDSVLSGVLVDNDAGSASVTDDKFIEEM